MKWGIPKYPIKLLLYDIVPCLAIMPILSHARVGNLHKFGLLSTIDEIIVVVVSYSTLLYSIMWSHGSIKIPH